MATDPVPAPAPKFDIAVLLKLAQDLPQLAALVEAAVQLAAAEKTAVGLKNHFKLAEPVIESALDLGDLVLAQLKG